MTAHITESQAALHIMAKVLPGNKIEIQLPPESEIGQEVDVFIVLPKVSKTKQLDVLQLIQTARQRHANRTAPDIDQQIQAEKASWDL